MGVTKHIRVTSEKIKDAALATVDFADDSITAAKVLDHTLGSQNLSTANVIIQGTAQLKDAVVESSKLKERLVHGSGYAIAGGTYTKFTPAFGGVPQVVAIGYGSAVALKGAPVVGSFALKQGTAGTISANYVAWGAR